MTPKKPVATVLILDDDLGFAVWLGRALNDAGLRAFPASRSEEAKTIVRDLRLQHVDLLIANLDLPGCRELIATLEAREQGLKVLAIHGPGARNGKEAEASLRRPNSKDPSQQAYVRSVKKALA